MPIFGSSLNISVVFLDSKTRTGSICKIQQGGRVPPLLHGKAAAISNVNSNSNLFSTARKAVLSYQVKE